MVQVLGDVELITKQEMEAALEEVVVPETTIDSKVDAAKAESKEYTDEKKALLDAQIGEVASAIDVETSARTAADEALNTRISDEEAARHTAESTLGTRISEEEQGRQAADAQLADDIATLNETIAPVVTKVNNIGAVTTASFEDTVTGVRFNNLPLAQLVVENLDKEISVGDTLATVSAAFLPKTPVTFSMVSVVTDNNADAYAHLELRLDAAGNINVINKTVLAEVFAGNINSTTILYFTKE